MVTVGRHKRITPEEVRPCAVAVLPMRRTLTTCPPSRQSGTGSACFRGTRHKRQGRAHLAMGNSSRSPIQALRLLHAQQRGRINIETVASVRMALLLEDVD